jgi:glycosyltransferase involved in cell wall biosynthesis
MTRAEEVTDEVCVVLPVYNAAPYLALALASVQLQTHTQWQLVVVDDGSSDRSLTIAQTFATQDLRIRVVSDGQNLGLTRRLNQMPELSEAPLIARMDADDIMHPDRLMRQTKFFALHPELHVLGTAAYAIDHVGIPYGFKRAATIPTIPAEFLRGAPFIHPSVMMKRDWIRCHRYNPDYERAEDYELWWRTQGDSHFDNLDEPLLFYRERGLPYRGKYRRTSVAKRRVLRQVQQWKLARAAGREWLSSHAKDMMYDVAALTGREQWLIERRSRPLSAGEALDAHMILSRVARQAQEVMR